MSHQPQSLTFSVCLGFWDYRPAYGLFESSSSNSVEWRSHSVLRLIFYLDCASSTNFLPSKVKASWNVMAHAQKPDFVFRRNGRVHLNRRGRQISRLLAAYVCASAVVMLDAPCSEVVWRVLATHSIRQFPLHVPSRASPCAITFQLEYISYLGNTPCHKYPYSVRRGFPYGTSFRRIYLTSSKLFNSVIKRVLLEKLVVAVVKKLSAF